MNEQFVYLWIAMTVCGIIISIAGMVYESVDLRYFGGILFGFAIGITFVSAHYEKKLALQSNRGVK